MAAFPFDPGRKLVSRAHRDRDDTITVSVGGAPEQLLARCDLPPDQRAATQARVGELAQQGMRVIAFARRQLIEAPADRDSAESDLTFIGLAWFADPLRDGVPQAAADLTAAGVATIVVTGDHPATEEWWSGPANGIGHLGLLMETQPPGMIDRIKQEYDRLTAAYLTKDGVLALPTAALLASGRAT